MYNTLKDWADNYNPLTRMEELQLIEEHKGNSQVLMTMVLQHNARYIIKYIHKWSNTYYNDLDECASVVMLTLTKSFPLWKYTECSYYYHIKYKVMNALRGNKPKMDHDEITEQNGGILEDDHNDDDILWDTIQDVLNNDKEYTMIYNIYKLNMSIKDAGRIYGIQTGSNSSRKHRDILNKLQTMVDYQMIVDIMMR